jgi:hypothetical protein
MKVDSPYVATLTSLARKLGISFEDTTLSMTHADGGRKMLD